MTTDEPLVLTLMCTLALSDRVRRRLESIAPAIELHQVDYMESSALRNARSAGRPTAADLATAPRLTDQEWEILERSSALVLLDVPDGLLDRASGLRWVQTISAGTEHLDVAGIEARGIVLTSGAGVASAPIADFVIGRLIQVWRDFRILDDLQRAREWEIVQSRRIGGLTMGIVGLGSIGRAVARRARAMDMRVVANRRRASPGDTDPDVDELFAADQLDQMLPQCDAVVVSAPATSATIGLFDRARIASMKPGSVLCNVARGALVDEDALVDALTAGHLGAAIIDTTSQEPTPRTSRLWGAPNCYLSPHIAAVADGYDDVVLELVARNLARFVDHDEMENVVVDPRGPEEPRCRDDDP